MKLATMPAATAAATVPAVAEPDDEAQKRTIARAFWTDLLWLMPQDRTVTVTVCDGRVAVELGPLAPAPATPAH